MLSRLSHAPPVFPVPECLSNLDLPPRNDWMLKHDPYLNYLLKYILTLLLTSQTQNFQKWRLHSVSYLFFTLFLALNNNRFPPNYQRQKFSYHPFFIPLPFSPYPLNHKHLEFYIQIHFIYYCFSIYTTNNNWHQIISHPKNLSYFLTYYFPLPT